jgi:hypothetical protein
MKEVNHPLRNHPAGEMEEDCNTRKGIDYRLSQLYCFNSQHLCPPTEEQ